MNCKCPKCGFERPCSALAAQKSSEEQSQNDRDMETIGAGIELSLKLRDGRLFNALDRALMQLIDEIEQERKARN